VRLGESATTQKPNLHAKKARYIWSI